MKISVGDDLVENSRIRETYERFGKKFLERVFTSEEAEYCLSKKDPIPHLAARFACKEAFIKAICLNDGEVLDMKEIELAGNYFGKKELKLYGKCLERFNSAGFDSFTVSISHTENYSTSVVVLYRS